LLKKLDIHGNPYIGVFCKGCEDLTIVSPTLGKAEIKIIEEALGTEVVSTTIAGSIIPGVLVAMNSRGMVVTDFATEEELAPFKKDILRIPDKHNAAGNNILTNDYHALVNPDLKKSAIREVEDVLGVEAVRGTIAGMKTVGTAAVATNKGVLCHPHTTESEIALLRELFKVPVSIGTANYGTSVVGACMIANSKGAVIGHTTTGVEMNRIEEALGLI